MKTWTWKGTLRDFHYGWRRVCGKSLCDLHLQQQPPQ
jgi:hypothetical protein